MATDRIIGITLLVAGLLLIAYTLFLSFTFFTGSAVPPEIFTVPIPTVGLESLSLDNIPELLQSQLENLLPSGSIPRMLNFGIWSVFAGILIFAGTQISSLGVKLMRK
ncbi:MAG TPA: hypothetical protein ENI04_00780 [Candidatus Wildermuthbacteria bacterium]|nr:hypothetical protein [Candidatus Wildermuthbacteria bacterium]